MNQSPRNLALMAGVALIVIGVIAYLTGHHRIGGGIVVLGVIAGGASFVLPQPKTS
jgi:hypothetical protein